MVDVVVEKNFPAANLVPKVETGVAAFLAKYPQYDGDGVTIAIFDSGVDPKADGLQTLPNGEAKVVERFDCSGCGDVDMSRTVQAEEDGTVTTIHGRKLKLTERQLAENPSGEYRLGVKALFDLYPSKVRDRLLADEKLRTWDEQQKVAVADTARSLERFELKVGTNTSAFTPLERLTKDHLDQCAEALTGFEKVFNTQRPLYDCIMYHTEAQGWRVSIDTSETGDLSQGLELGEYSRHRDVKSIAQHLSVSVNVHQDGNTLEIVGMCSSHGTHVASIASGHHPNDPALNGIAPAAKIVSLTIGDSRLGSMETGTALVRAMIRVMELCKSGRQVHVINMSYGEHAHFSSSGRLGKLMAEVVNKYGVVWVASAGNHGPALCTIGTPPDIKHPIFIGVGAYVSPEMIEAEYALRHKLPANCYTWTSRDPCIDGGQGVTICAPGAAIASVPEFTQSKQQLMHGTSMAAPHVAGSIALLISGLLKANVPYSPYSVKRALWNTATRLEHIDAFAQGNGLLNVERAFETLSVQQVDTLVRYSVTVDQGAKGIHLRQVNAVAKEYAVSVEPFFLNDQDVAPQEKIKFNVRITLCPSEPWVKCGTFLDLCNAPRLFNVTVDPTGLPPGVHSARIRAYDSANVARGTLFEVPITVVQPHPIDINANGNLFQLPALPIYRSNTITRTFIQVPPKCTWALLRLRSPNSPQALPARFFVHTLQLAPQRYCKEYETQKLFSVSQEQITQHAFRCIGDTVLEVCIAKFWSTAGEAQLEASIEFRGIYTGAAAALAAPVNVMHAAQGVHRIDFAGLTAADEAQPAVQLKSAVMVLRPNDSKITVLTDRDTVPDGRHIYQNMLQYTLHLNKSAEVSVHAPFFSDVLYESEFESQLWHVYDANKSMVMCGDAYSADTFVKLEKGDFVVRLQVRHEKRDLLEKVAESTVLVTFKLPTPITLDAFASYRNAVQGTKKLGTLPLPRNVVRPVFFVPLPIEKITKANVPNQCSWLNGSLSLSKDEAGRKLEINNFRYILVEGPAVKKQSTSGPSSASTSNNGSSNNKDAVPPARKMDEYKECLRDFYFNMLMKMEINDAETIYSNACEQYPDFLPFHTALITRMDTFQDLRSQLPFCFRISLKKKTQEEKEALRKVQERIVELANKVIAGIDVSALLVYLGTKVDYRADAAKIKTAMDKQRLLLMEAMVRKAVALGKLRCFESTTESTDDQLRGEIHTLYLDLGKFADYADLKVSPLLLWHSYHLQHHGRMFKLLQRLYDDKLSQPYLEEMRLVAVDREWHHVSALLYRLIKAGNPGSYRPF